MEEKQIFGYVYLVKNLVNGKMYFGITENDFDTRYGGNIAKNTHNEHLKRSIEKYGIENFEVNKEFDIAYTEDDLWDLEDMYMCVYNTLDPRYGYNKRRSGSKRKGCGKLNEETRKKLSKSLQGKPKSEEHKRKQSESMMGKLVGDKNPFYGKHHTDEFKKQHSQRMKERYIGDKNPMYGKGYKVSGDKNPRARKVICLETLQVFTTIKEAKGWCGSGSINAHLNGDTKSAGKHPITGEKLHWMYYDEYLKLQEQEEQSNKTQDLVTEVA